MACFTASLLSAVRLPANRNPIIDETRPGPAHQVSRSGGSQSVPREIAGTEPRLKNCLANVSDLDQFRRASTNLYERVRALFFLSNIYRYHLPPLLPENSFGRISYAGYMHLLNRRFDEAIDEFLGINGQVTDTSASALAVAYHELGFQTLANQVRRSVRSVSGNQWMFRVGHPSDHPLRLRTELLQRDPATGLYPYLLERTPVRMDLSHSGWSDIFFLGMDFPEGARVLNVSVNLGVRGRDRLPRPPIEVFLRVIDEPVLRLASVDLKAKADIRSLRDLFDFAQDYLGLLKAGVIAAGIVPPGLEGSQQRIEDVLARLVGPGLGLELVTKVNDIPKGSRLAVSTTLLAAIIAVSMRATKQVSSLVGRAPGERTAVDRCTRHFGRMVGWLGRRLAGFRRHLAGNQNDRRSGGGSGRRRVRHQPWTSPAESPHSGTRRRLEGDATAVDRQSRSGSRRDGPGRRPDTSNGDREILAAISRGMARQTGGDGHPGPHRNGVEGWRCPETGIPDYAKISSARFRRSFPGHPTTTHRR